jgi:hypothetical protein
MKSNHFFDRKIVAWSTVTTPHTKASEEENAPKKLNILPEELDMRIWTIQERSGEMMKAHGYNPATDFRAFILFPPLTYFRED